MSDGVNDLGGTGPSHRSVEIGVAVAMAALALIGLYGGMLAGVGWGAEGPQAGFFPFYVSLIVLISCVINLVNILRLQHDGQLFATWPQLKQVMAVVAPTTVYVFIVPILGMYVSSALLIGVFMRWIGHYRWILVLVVAIGVPVLTFVMFEKWFLVPLPKGPLEDWLGL